MLGLALLLLVFWLLTAEGAWMRVVALVCLPLVLYAAAELFAPPLRDHRPPVWILRVSGALAGIAFLGWAATCLLRIDLVSSADVKRTLGSGAMAHTLYGAGKGKVLTPGVYMQIRPNLPVVFSGVVMTDGWRWSSCTVTIALWPPVAAAGVAAWILWRLRRERLPVGLCPGCGYDLTGNVSGVCPECGAAVGASPRERGQDPSAA